MWTRNSDVSNRNMLKHFIYSSFSKSTTSFLCSTYYRYSSKLSSFFCILSFLVRAISIDQTFYSATHYLAAVWLDSRHDFNNRRHSLWQWFDKNLAVCLSNLCRVLLFWRFWKIVKLSHLLHKWCFIYVYWSELQYVFFNCWRSKFSNSFIQMIISSAFLASSRSWVVL